MIVNPPPFAAAGKVKVACVSPAVGVSVAGGGGVTGVMVTLWLTGVAAVKFVLPGWLAEIVQVPAVRIEMVVPLAVQTAGVVVPYVIASPEEAMATGLTANVPPCAQGRLEVVCALKVIVCDACVMVTLRSTGVAAFQFTLPAWLARMVHVPAVTMVTVVPLTVQTEFVCDV